MQNSVQGLTFTNVRLGNPVVNTLRVSRNSPGRSGDPTACLSWGHSPGRTAAAEVLSLCESVRT